MVMAAVMAGSGESGWIKYGPGPGISNVMSPIPGLAFGVRDGLTQRAGAAVGGGGDRVRGGEAGAAGVLDGAVGRQVIIAQAAVDKMERDDIAIDLGAGIGRWVVDQGYQCGDGLFGVGP